MQIFSPRLRAILCRAAILQIIWVLSSPCEGQPYHHDAPPSSVARPLSDTSNRVTPRMPITVSGTITPGVRVPSASQTAALLSPTLIGQTATGAVTRQFIPLANLPQANIGYRAASAVTREARIVLTPIHDFEFGSAVTGSTGGTITVSPDGDIRCNGSTLLVPTAVIAPAEFQYTIFVNGFPAFASLEPDGFPGRQADQHNIFEGNSQIRFHIRENGTSETDDSNHVAILLPKEIVLQRTGLEGPISVDGLTYEVDGNRILIGGTLHLPPNLPAGPYSGDYTIRVNRE